MTRVLRIRLLCVVEKRVIGRVESPTSIDQDLHQRSTLTMTTTRMRIRYRDSAYPALPPWVSVGQEAFFECHQAGT